MVGETHGATITAPAGMTIDPGGVIHWRAGVMGSYGVTVSVSDNVNPPVTQDFTLSVWPPVAANQPPEIVSHLPGRGEVTDGTHSVPAQAPLTVGSRIAPCTTFSSVPSGPRIQAAR